MSVLAQLQAIFILGQGCRGRSLLALCVAKMTAFRCSAATGRADAHAGRVWLWPTLHT